MRSDNYNRNRFGSRASRPDFPNRGDFRAPGADGPAPINRGDASTGPQRGVAKVQSNPGDPSFPRAIVAAEMAGPKSKGSAPKVHPAMAHLRQKHQRGAPVFDQGARVGLDSAE
jgi:hypothetical protein